MLLVIGEALEPPAVPPAPAPPEETETATRAEPSEPQLLFQGGAGLNIPGSTPAFALRSTARYPIVQGFLGGVALDASLVSALGVLVVEPVLSLEALDTIPLPLDILFSFGLEAGPLAHIYHRDGATHARLDARFAAVGEIRFPILGAGLALLPYLRLTAVEQRVLGELAYEANQFGVLLILFVSSR
jgi:hypothetical protein